MDQGLIGQAARYCRRLTVRSRSNFYYAFLFLPRVRREALEAVYAYCRLIDDVVDEGATRDDKQRGLDHWRAEVEAIFAVAPPATPLHPVAARLRSLLPEFALRKEDLLAVIDGCAMDIDKSRYANWDELRLYCYRVASAVGLLCVEIFGYSPSQKEAVRRYATDLGIALQLTNILRDVSEDAHRGRIYLPLDELARFGVAEEDLVQGRGSPELLELLRCFAARAREHYSRARAAIDATERRKLVIAEIMGDIYYALLEEIEARNYNVLAGKTEVPRRAKMRIALGTYTRARLHQLFAGA